ncbi:hypothetical protein PTKIN_Ptkin12aG0017800 [Pterospermum kingtungense]
MGKKVNHQVASTKTCKKEKQLHSLIKAMRPKVYITDSSSFKQLVQELTGYQSQITHHTRPEEIKKVVPVIEIEDQVEIVPAANTTTLSMDSSFYSFDSCDQLFDQLVEINQNHQGGLMQTADDDIFSMFDYSEKQQTDWLAYQNLESWLLDADQPYYPQHEQEISLFDCDLSWLI